MFFFFGLVPIYMKFNVHKLFCVINSRVYMLLQSVADCLVIYNTKLLNQY